MAKQTPHSHPEAEPLERTDTGAAEGMPQHGSKGDHFGEVKSDDMVTKVATIAVVGVGVALISAELIPGMLTGVAAAMVPAIGPKVRPLLKSPVKAGFSA